MNKSFSVLSIIAISFICCMGNAQAASFVFTRDLSLGTRNSDVSALQQFLIDGKFLTISAPTGYFGPATRAAVSKWQTSVGINPPVGFFGRLSREKISSQTTQTSVSISTEPTVKTSSISGCTSLVGFSPITGQLCSGFAASSAAPATLLTSPSTTPAIKTNDGHPVRIQISKISVDAAFQYNGLKSDGTMEIPNNVTDVGWFTGSVKPGERGTSVVTGHVAQIRGGVITKPGVFSNLTELKVGDTLSVTNDKGELLTFVVRESRSYDPSADATDVFAAKDNDAHMNIITCEGTWNPGQLSYSQRLVVFTTLVK